MKKLFTTAVLAAAMLWAGTSASAAPVEITLSNGQEMTEANEVPADGIIINVPSGTATISGTISGSGSLTKTGAGALIITGRKTYTGSTTVSQGALAVQVQEGRRPLIPEIAFNTSSVRIAAGASFAFNATGNFTFDGEISGAGRLSKTGTGTLTLTGSKTYTGATAVSQGTLNVTVQEGQTRPVTPGIAFNTSSVSIAALATITFNTPGRFTFDREISGAGSLTKTGIGTLVLTGNKTYTGATAVSQGTLNVQVKTAIIRLTGGGEPEVPFDSPSVSIASGASFVFDVVPGSFDIYTFPSNKQFSGAGNFTKTGIGRLDFSSGNFTCTGTLTVSEGTMRASANAYLYSFSAVKLTGTGILDVSGFTDDIMYTLNNLSTDAGTEIITGAIQLELNYPEGTRGVLSGRFDSEGTNGWNFGSGTMEYRGSGINDWANNCVLELHADLLGDLTLYSTSTLAVGGSRSVGRIIIGADNAAIHFDLTAAEPSKLTVSSPTDNCIQSPSGNKAVLHVKADAEGTYDLITAQNISPDYFTLNSTGSWTGGMLQVSGNTLQLVPAPPVIDIKTGSYTGDIHVTETALLNIDQTISNTTVELTESGSGYKLATGSMTVAGITLPAFEMDNLTATGSGGTYGLSPAGPVNTVIPSIPVPADYVAIVGSSTLTNVPAEITLSNAQVSGNTVSFDMAVVVTVSLSGGLLSLPITLNVAFEGANNTSSVISQIQGGSTALSIYPNPTTGKVYLQTAGSIKVYSLQGALLHETSGTETDLSAYPQGMYILQAGSQTAKVVKE